MPAENFNAGVLSLSPSIKTFELLLNFTYSLNQVPRDAEQGLLNQFFPAPRVNVIYPSEYTRTILPMKYNLNIEARISHPLQWSDVWPDARIVHFTSQKPLFTPNCSEGSSCLFEQGIGRWFREYEELNRLHGWSGIVASPPPRWEDWVSENGP